MLSKEFPGGILVLTGANSATGLRSMPARYIFLDEVDAYPGDVDGEGDPIALADGREVRYPTGNDLLRRMRTVEAEIAATSAGQPVPVGRFATFPRA